MCCICFSPPSADQTEISRIVNPSLQRATLRVLMPRYVKKIKSRSIDYIPDDELEEELKITGETEISEVRIPHLLKVFSKFPEGLVIHATTINHFANLFQQVYGGEACQELVLDFRSFFFFFSTADEQLQPGLYEISILAYAFMRYKYRFENLTEIQINHAGYVFVSPLFIQSLKLLENFKALKVSQAKDGEEYLELILETLFDRLERLALISCEIQKVPKFLFEKCSKLKSVDFSENKFGSIGFETIIPGIAPHIEELKMRGCDISKTNKRMMKECGNLKVLHLGNNEGMKVAELDNVLSAIASDRLEELNVSTLFSAILTPVPQNVVLLLKRFVKLRCLDFSGWKIGNEGFMTILSVLYETIEEFSAAACGITKIMTKSWLLKCKKLKILDISRNKVNEDDANLIFNTLRGTLEVFKASDCPSLANFDLNLFQTCYQLREISIDLDTDFYLELGLVLRQMPSIKEFNCNIVEMEYLLHELSSIKLKLHILLCAAKLFPRLGANISFTRLPMETIKRIALTVNTGERFLNWRGSTMNNHPL